MVGAAHPFTGCVCCVFKKEMAAAIFPGCICTYLIIYALLVLYTTTNKCGRFTAIGHPVNAELFPWEFTGKKTSNYEHYKQFPELKEDKY